MTKHLLSRLSGELKELEHEIKNVLPEEISKAAALGDLSENAEYEAALDRQRLLKSRFRTLQKRITEVARVDISRLPKDLSGYGSVIQLFDLDEDKEVSYQLVMPEDADVKHGRISVNSPIGKSLIGKREGDEVTVNIPSGIKNYEIIGMKPYHLTEQDL